MAQTVKNPPAIQETRVWSLGQEDSLEMGLATPSSILAWRISWVKSGRLHSAAAAAKSLQSCLNLWDPTDGSPPGCPVPGILQARTLEWVAISFSNAWKWKVEVKSLSRVRPSATPWIAAFQAPPSMGFSRQEYWSGVMGSQRAGHNWATNTKTKIPSTGKGESCTGPTGGGSAGNHGGVWKLPCTTSGPLFSCTVCFIFRLRMTNISGNPLSFREAQDQACKEGFCTSPDIGLS